LFANSFALIMEAICFSETSILTNVIRHQHVGILHSHSRETLKYYTRSIALTGWALWQRRNVSPVRYKVGFISQKTFFIVTAVKTSNLT
jgi:hypothetical protein